MQVHLISAVFNIAANDEPVIGFPIDAALPRSTDPTALRCFDIVLVFYFFIYLKDGMLGTSAVVWLAGWMK